MNDEEAAALLEKELTRFRAEPYADLVRRIPAGSLHLDLTGPSGTKYQAEVQFFWDNRRRGDIRVMGSIDDFGPRAYLPLCRDFIKAKDGSFVGE